jgi:hypothetical protein
VADNADTGLMWECPLLLELTRIPEVPMSPSGALSSIRRHGSFGGHYDAVVAAAAVSGSGGAGKPDGLHASAAAPPPAAPTTSALTEQLAGLKVEPQPQAGVRRPQRRSLDF